MSNYVSWKKPLLLAIVLVLLSGVAIFLEYKHKPEQEAKIETGKHPFQIKNVQIAAITVSEGEHAYSFKCLDLESKDSKLCKPGDNSKWQLASPATLRADDSNVNSLLSAINNLQSTETIDLGVETPEKKSALLKEYGLGGGASPRRKVEVTLPNASPQILLLGETHPIGDSIFGMIAGNDNKIMLIPNYFKSQFEHDLNFWRDKKIMSLAAHEIQTLSLKGSKGDIEAFRKDGNWMLVDKKNKSEQIPGDIESVDNWISTATYLTAKLFVTENKDDSKGKATLRGTIPTLSFTLGNDKKKITVQFYTKKGNAKAAWATVSDLSALFEFDIPTRDRLDKGIKDFRLAKLITTMDRFSAKKLQFSGSSLGSTPLVLVQENGKWLTVEGNKKTETTSDKVQGLLDRISGNRIKNFISGAPTTGQTQSGIQMTLGDDKNEKVRQILFWKQDQKLFAKDLLATRNEIYEIDPSVIDSIPWDRNVFSNSQAPQNPVKR